MGSQISTQSVTGGGQASETVPTVKPCCVCKDEKAFRDECMLFTKSNNPQEDCATAIDKYRSCMEGFGFKMP